MNNLNRLTRRGILAGGAASSVLSVSGLSAQIAPNSISSNLKVSITLNGTTYVYPDGPKIPSYYVIFSEDGRVVFHLGALGALTAANARPAPYRMGVHHVKIEKAGAVVFEADIPGHWWNAEWTYRPAQITTKKTPAQIVAANRMFPYGDTGCKTNPVSNYQFKGPMDSAGITLYMPTTGERPDIGLITDPSGSYMLTGKPGPMLAWAQAAGSCPMHFRDEGTGKPIDLLKYPKANCYYDETKQGTPWLAPGPMEKDFAGNTYPTFGGGWVPQQAHYCEMSYVAYCATQDASFLEDLQYSANFTILCDGYASGQRGVATIAGEYRGIAWAFRNLFMAHAATQDAEAAGALPASCQRAEYWKKLLDVQLAYYKKNMVDPNNQTFRLVANGVGRFGPWQCDYMLKSLAFGVLTGHSDWAPLYVWALGNAIARTNNKSGYPPGWGTAYYLQPYPHKLDASGNPQMDTLDTTKPQFNWYDAFIYAKVDPQAPGSGPTQAQIDALKAAPLNGGKAMNGEGNYMMNTRAVLVMAQYLDNKGLADVRATYPELDQCFTTADRMLRNYGGVNPRASVVL